MKVLITGGGGFVARYLADELSSDEILLADLKEDMTNNIVKLDITVLAEVEKLIKEFKPDRIVHLAAIASPRFAGEELIYKVNIEGSRNLLLATKKYVPEARVLLVSSGYVYGDCRNAAKETDELRPIGAYAKSKVMMEELAYDEFEKIDFVIARPFNHSGKGQQLGLVLPDLANQIKLLKQKEISEIHTFNLDDTRDFSHVKDVVRAYGLLLEKAEPHEIYNICSGKPTAIREILDELIVHSGLKNVKVNEEKTPSILAQSFGDNSKIKQLGWNPKLSLEEIVCEFV